MRTSRSFSVITISTTRKRRLRVIGTFRRVAGVLAGLSILGVVSSTTAVAAPPAAEWTSYSHFEALEACHSVSSPTACEVFGSADSAGRLSGLSRLEYQALEGGVSQIPDGMPANANSGGSVLVEHRVRPNTGSITYTATFVVLPFDDPTTTVVEQTRPSGEGGAIWLHLEVSPPGCTDDSCVVRRDELLAGGDAQPPAIGDTWSLAVFANPPVGTVFPRGNATVTASLEVVAVMNDLSDTSAESSGAVQVTRIVASAGDGQ